MHERRAWLVVLAAAAPLVLLSHVQLVGVGLRLAALFSYLPSLPMFEQCELVTIGESAMSLLAWAGQMVELLAPLALLLFLMMLQLSELWRAEVLAF